jgi:hypothetical protein
VRAESAAAEATAALDIAIEKLLERLRREHDRANDHRAAATSKVRDKQTESSGFDPVALEKELKADAKLAKTHTTLEGYEGSALADSTALETRLAVGESIEARLGDTPLVIRRKVHAGEKLSINEALERMELLGHDFYLFIHESTGRSAAIYRRHGWSYGVIELES